MANSMELKSIYRTLNVIHPLQRANVVAVQDDLAGEFVPVALDLVVLDHDDDHVYVVKEGVEIVVLVLDDIPLDQRVIDLQGFGKVTLLALKELEGRALADVIDIFLVGQAVEADAAGVGDAVLLHDFVDAVQDEGGLAVVGLHGLVDDLGQARIVPHQEPRVHADAVAADAGAGLQDVHARVHIADADDLVHVHVVVTADARELIGKGDVHGPEGVLDDLGHFGRTDVRDHDFTLAEAGVAGLDLLPYRLVIGTDRAVVVQEFIDHVARDDALGRMDQIHPLAGIGNHRTDGLVDGAGRDRGLDHHRRPVGADGEHLLDRGNHVARVDFLGELVIRGRDGNDVHVRLLIFRGEADATLHGGGEQLVQPVLLEGRLAGIERCHQLFIVVRTDDLQPVGGQHQSRRKADIA